jgi:peptide/nickel transport system substrate-binding protein
MGTLREPACLNAFLERCHGNIPPAGHIMNLALRGAFEIGPGFTWQHDLVSAVDFTTKPPFTLTYHIRPEARWSDGRPITARDFVFTYTTLQQLAESDRKPLGLEFVRSVRPVDAKTVRVVLRSRFAGWRGLFSNVLPRHALRGEDFASVWLDRIHNPKTGAPIGSGAFLVQGREQGRALTFVRNPGYWGPHRAYLDRIVLRFCAECGDLGAEQLEWLRSGQLDLVMSIGASAQQVQPFRRLSGVRVLTAPGPLWEHFDIRIGRGGHPALRKKAVRQALAYGIDRAAIARLYGSLRQGYRPSESAAFLSASPRYRPNWRRYRHHPEKARRLLEQADCRRGSDGVYVCDGERLALRFVTTAGGGPRERTLELVQDRLGQVGIAVTPVYAPSLVVFNQVLKSGDFDLVLFNHIHGSPDTAATAVDLYGCGGSQNYSGYCQRLVTRDLDQATRILDGARLAQVLNRADAQLAKDVPVIPLVERGLLAAFTTSVRNVNLNTRAWNPFANAENWWLAE